MQTEIVLKTVKEKGIKYIHLQFMDILGQVKSVMIPHIMLEKAMNEGIVFDGSSIVGYATIDESDMRAVPDPSTFQIKHDDPKTATIICDIYMPSGKRFEGDPRFVLQKVLKKAEERGYKFVTGPEFEFFLFKMEDGKPVLQPNDYGGYFDFGPIDQGEAVRKEILGIFSEQGYMPEAAHHEVAPGQHEIDLRYDYALTIADRILTLKATIKDVAIRHGLFASFMPKPIFGVNGNGMHVHQSLLSLDCQENMFYDPDSRWELSDIALYYIGGLIYHAKEISAVLNSWVNSYKRLVPGYEAPVYISWANLNRSALIRVPAGRGIKTRVELRNPDPAGNPYLQFAVMLGAGLDGIERKIEPPEPIELNIYALTPEEKERLGIHSLPESLGEALYHMERSELVQKILGDHIFRHFIVVKRREWHEYRAQITHWEIEKLLPIL
ncbi:MAG: type I glutamate--ammonia ligase [Thermoplasmata archaeon]|nr:type I glutamate--ammonia ligase [Thermoplasmata archaeon]